MINLNDAARALYTAAHDHGIETVFYEPWEQLPDGVRFDYCNAAGSMLNALHLDYVANEAPNADLS